MGGPRKSWHGAPLLVALGILIITCADWLPSVIAFASIEEARIDISALTGFVQLRERW